MTDRIPNVRPIMLRPGFINAARAGSMRHITLPSTFLPKARTAVGEDARREQAAVAGTMRLPTPWTKLAAGDRLWVQEEVGELIDARGGNNRAFYKVDLLGGHIPIPGGSRGTRYSTRWRDASSMPREHSRYTLEITGVRIFNAWDITWPEMEAEGPFSRPTTKGAWWEFRYGVALPWKDNPEVVGLSFTFTNANIDGTVYVPDAPHAGGMAAIDRLFAEKKP